MGRGYSGPSVARAVRLLTAVVSLLLGCTLVPPRTAEAQVRQVRRILIVNEAGVSYPAIDTINRGIRTQFESSPYKIEIYSEYLETILFPDTAVQQEFRAFILRKYQNRKPDVIITVGPSALRFMQETHKAAFSGVPLVFCLPIGSIPGSPVLDSDFTGVENDMAPAATLEAALRLQPDIKHVFAVGGQGNFDKQLQVPIRDQLKPFEKRVDITYLTTLAMPDLLQRLRHLPSGSVVLLTTIGEDAAGNHFKSSEVGPLVISAANAPVFTLFDTYINHGEVGGDLSSFSEQGRIAGSMALRILNGETPQNIPRATEVTRYMFDWQALRRWGLKERNLPSGSIVINRQPTFWETNKQYVVPAAIALLAQTFAILALLWQRAKRRKTEAELVASNERLRSAMKDLRESEDQLQAMVTSAMDAIIAIDRDQRIVVFNSAAERMFGYTSEKAIGTGIDRFIPGGILMTQGQPSNSNEGSQDGTPGDSNDGPGLLWGVRRNGEHFPMEASIAQVNGGTEKLFTVIIRDVTERKEAEEARFRHAAVMESSEDAIISLNLDSAITGWNIGAQRMYGYSEAEVLGKSLDVIVPPHLEQEQQDILRRVRDGERIEHYETVRVTKDGRQIDVSVSIVPLRDWAGKIVGISGIARDITVSKQAEATLRESEERFRLVANMAPVMIWMSGVDKLRIYFNKPWLDFTGRTVAQELGHGWSQGVHPEDLDKCLRTYREAFDERESLEMEYRLRRRDGEYRWVVDLGVPRFDPDGSFAGYIGSCIDVTEHKLAEEALLTVSRRLIEAHEEERSWLARELHDDVNQRLALIAVNLDVLKREVPQSATDTSRRLSEVREQIKELGTDVQALSHRLHSSKLKYLGLTAAVTALCREFSDRKGVQIALHCDAIPRTVPEEISLCLFRVLQEALQNASKHSGSKHYQVTIKYAPNEIELTVSDPGVGFDPQLAMQGRGLGITSMRERLKLVEGELSIERQSPTGTVVRATVPLRQKAKSASAGKTGKE
jgi:PAS domain S-box-containing protein